MLSRLKKTMGTKQYKFILKGNDLTEDDVKQSDVVLFWMDDFLENVVLAQANGFYHEQWVNQLYDWCEAHNKAIMPPKREHIHTVKSKLYMKLLEGKVPHLPTKFITKDNVQDAENIITSFFEQHGTLHFKRGYAHEESGHFVMKTAADLKHSLDYIQSHLVQQNCQLILVQPSLKEFEEVKLLVMDGKVVEYPKRVTASGALSILHDGDLPTETAKKIVTQLQEAKLFSQLPPYFRIDLVWVDDDTLVLNEIETVQAEYTMTYQLIVAGTENTENRRSKNVTSHWKTTRVVEWHQSFLRKLYDDKHSIQRKKRKRSDV